RCLSSAPPRESRSSASSRPSAENAGYRTSPSMVEESTAFRPPEETPTVIAGERASLQFTPGALLGDRYRVVSLIGRGGMGDVYRADDLKLGQTVALKFLARHGHAQRLFEEVRIGRQISHPNVCR